MASDTTKDMTAGAPARLIMGFSIPLLFGMLFQQFYSMVDTIIVGRYLGVDALAGVGSTGSINFMVIGFCMGVCSGFSIPVAQKFGAGDEKALRRFVANSAWLSIIFAAVMTISVGVLCRSILVWMKTPDNIIEYAYQYIFIIFLGLPVVFLYNLLSGIIRSLGDSKTPLFFLLLSSLLNIVLDFVFILFLHMGVSGAAWATVISQGVSGVLCLLYMKKKYAILHFEKEEWRFDGHFISILCSMGIPMGLQYSITAIGSVILQSAVNTIGSAAVASVTAASKISIFFCCPFDALGSTMATYSGQNIGARKLGRIHQGMKFCLIAGAAYAVAALAVMVFFGRNLALLFVNAKEVLIVNQVSLFLIVNAVFYIPLCLVNVIRFSIQGIGFPKLAILAGVCEMLARAVTGFILVPFFGFTAVCLASPIAWICADIFLIFGYRSVMKKMEGLFSTGMGQAHGG